MSSSILHMSGEVLYAIVHSPRENDMKDGKLEYSLLLEFTQDRLDKLKNLGISPATKLRLVEGKTYIKLIANGFQSDGSENTIFVVDSDSKPIPKTTLIGNGSKVEVSAQIFPSSRGKSKVLRLLGVKVLDLVPYERKEKTVEEVFDSSIGTII